MKYKWWHIIVLLFLIADLLLSFSQYYHTALDGDMAESVLPTPTMEALYNDPLALRIFNDPTPYHNPNRFFSHYSYFLYFNAFPKFLQNFISPINSIYVSAAIFKLFTQVFLIFLLSLLIFRNKEMQIKDLIVIGAFLTPFFQSFGYRSFIGIIDISITYVFFYAFPIALLILYYLPLLNIIRIPVMIFQKFLFWIIWMMLAMIVCLSGPLNPGVILIISMLYGINNFFIKDNGEGWRSRFKSISGVHLGILIPVTCMSLYSIYIGSFNSYTINSQIPIAEIYGKIPEGILLLMTGKLAWPSIIAWLIINSIILYRLKGDSTKSMRSDFIWVFVFFILYVLLLPLGGYRSYRPLVIRYDTILPVTMACLYLLGRSSLLIIETLSSSKRMVYISFIITVLLIFTNADRKIPTHNSCEMNALRTLAEAKESPVYLSNKCTVISWQNFSDPDSSIYNARLIRKWGITENEILYYQKRD